MEICFIQTSDPYVYYRMLTVTSNTVRRYCRYRNFYYECYIGIKRGYFAWHATYSRIFLFKELIDRGFRGWMCYVDADAFIANQDFDLAAYLADKNRYGAILTPSEASDNFWDINSGVMFLNARSPWAHWCVDDWLQRFMAISDAQLRDGSHFEVPGGLPHDQILLHALLREHPDSRSHVLLEAPALLNCTIPDRWKECFIAQYLRSWAADLADRTNLLTQTIRHIMADHDEASGKSDAFPIPDLSERQEKLIVSSLYLALLGRVPDQAGLAHYTKALHETGLEYGLTRVLESMINSNEFNQHMRGRSRPPRREPGAMSRLWKRLLPSKQRSRAEP